MFSSESGYTSLYTTATFTHTKLYNYFLYQVPYKAYKSNHIRNNIMLTLLTLNKKKKKKTYPFCKRFSDWVLI